MDKLVNIKNIPEKRVLVAIGDIHGQYELLVNLLDEVEGSIEQDGTIIFLGDTIDKGVKSRQVIDRLLRGSSKPGISYEFIRGNHEQMLLNAYDNPNKRNVYGWIREGGLETLISYGAEDDEQIDNGEWRQLIPLEHINFMRNKMCDIITSEQFIFVHAGLRSGIPIDQQNKKDTQWIRQRIDINDEYFKKTIVHGHSVVKEPIVTKNEIAIDTGACENGILTAIELRESEHSVIQSYKDRTDKKIKIREFETQWEKEMSLSL